MIFLNFYFFHESPHFHEFITFLIFLIFLNFLIFYISVSSPRICLYQYPESLHQSFITCPHINSCLSETAEFDTIAIGASRRYILATSAYQSNDIYCFNRKENIAEYRISMLINTDFNRQHNIDEIIQHILEAGLFTKWHSEYTKVKIQSRIEFGSAYVTIEQLSAAWVFGIVGGSILSTITFIAEITIYRMNRKPKAALIWLYLERFFDGQRHYLKSLPERLEQSRIRRYARSKK